VKVAVIGTGHVGLVTCVALATIGHDVTPTTSTGSVIAPSTEGPPLLRARTRGSPRAGDGRRSPGVHSRNVFICVGTPPRADGEVNLLAVERCAIEIARHAGDEVVVVEKSTGPAGTADRLRLTLAREGGSQRFDIASDPEFLREGSALRDALETASSSAWNPSELRRSCVSCPSL